MNNFNRDALPPVVDVLALLDISAPKATAKGYAQVACPIHGDAKPSLSIHLERDNFKCWACGATGGDVLDLYRKARGLSFVQAARDLGAWEGR